jgi:hypothetical protein
MNKLTVSLVSIMFFLGVSADKACAQSETINAKHEIMMVSVYGGLNSIYIVHSDDRTEIVQFQRSKEREAILFDQLKALRRVLQRLYDEGWEIASELSAEAGIPQYVLKRELKQ